MDRMQDSGSCDEGSNPFGTTLPARICAYVRRIMHSRFHESGISFRVQFLTEFQEGLLMRVSSLANSLFIYVGLAFGSLWYPVLYPAGAISVVSIY